MYLHGRPGGHVSDRDIRILSSLSVDGYDVYLYDQTGSGQSGRLKNINDYTVERHLTDLKEIIQKTGARKVMLIGRSVMTYNNLTKVQDPRPEIKNLAIPVLVMKGECDNQKWGFTNEYLQLLRNHELVIIPGAGHFISVEQPELYIKTIQQFLNK